ncbi:MAG TPA: cation diffusion facilitator family transporter [Kofleriaceae bacterium]|jgi:cobalt-zinc-cadmium efflux system protein|nr:cation diffusion facilitator family transporter [Kofleriaceae bacterium]
MHDHAHGHAHHSHPPINANRAFAIGISLNVAFVLAEVVAGVIADSTALLADAAHSLGDVLGLAMAWGATWLARRQRTARRTYGLKRTTILAGLANAMLILFAIGGVTWEAIRRIGDPAPIDGGIVAVVAAIGVLVNGGAAMMFAAGRERDVNRRGAYLHLMADAAVSAAVVIAGLIVWQTGHTWIDPATSIVVSIVILYGTIDLLREALDLLLDAVPSHIDPVAVEDYLAKVPDVQAVHDLHIWSMSTTQAALTVHLVMPCQASSPTLLRELEAEIEHRFGIAHTTIQIEPMTGTDGRRCASC